jgi:CRISPR-associated DxTHG motif protein
MLKISFLGLGTFDKITQTYSYSRTTYHFTGFSCESDYFPLWVQQFQPEGKLYIVSTEKGLALHTDRLRIAAPDFIPVTIPQGNSDTEMWQIFSALTETITYEENEEVIFDITHGFRHQPLLALSAIIFLKALKNINVKHIFYGAYEARDNANHTPVFDLLPFLNIIDWAYAVRQFISSGEMRSFASLLADIHNKTYTENSPVKSVYLKTAGETLRKMDDAFATLRLQEILKYARNFSDSALRLSTDFQNQIKAKPFSLLINKISAPFSGIADAQGSLFSREGFVAQKRIIEFYLKSGDYQQAITLMREFVVSLYMSEASGFVGKDIQDKDNREKTEKLLGDFRRAIQEKKYIAEVEKKFGDIWVSIIQVRNDIDHAGMNNNPASGGSLISAVKSLYENMIRNL